MLNHAMKQKLSVSLDKDLLKKIEMLVSTGRFRNKSHFVEYSLNNAVKHEKENQNDDLIGGENE